MLVAPAQRELSAAVAIMESIPELLRAAAASGPRDLICRVVARDTEHLQHIVNQLTATPATRRRTSHVVPARQVAPRSISPVEAPAQPSRGVLG